MPDAIVQIVQVPPTACLGQLGEPWRWLGANSNSLALLGVIWLAAAWCQMTAVLWRRKT